MFQAQTSLLFCILFLSGELQLSSSQTRSPNPQSQQCATNESVGEITKRLEDKQEELYEAQLRKLQLIISSTFSDIEVLVHNSSVDLYNRVLKDIQVLKAEQNSTFQEMKELIQSYTSYVPTQEPTTPVMENETNFQSSPTSVPTREPVSTGKELGLQNPPTSATSSCTTELATIQTDSTKGSFEYPVRACKDIPVGSPSGDYWVVNNCNKTPFKVYCDMTRSCCNDTGGDTGGWTRIVNLNMTNYFHQCPKGLTHLFYDKEPKRLCGKGFSQCATTKFRTYGINYTRVCGKIKGYQYGDPRAFYNSRYRYTINQPYVDGVSLTYGNSTVRKHIWSFAAGSDENSAGSHVCPCTRTDLTFQGHVPLYVGQDYFCDTANHDGGAVGGTPFFEDPLWDGDGCAPTSSCCCFNKPPGFCKQLPQPTTDEIELRICCHGSSCDTPLEVIELYIK